MWCIISITQTFEYNLFFMFWCYFVSLYVMQATGHYYLYQQTELQIKNVYSKHILGILYCNVFTCNNDQYQQTQVYLW